MILALALLLAKSLTFSFEYRDSNPYSLFPYYNAVTDTNPIGNLSNPAYLPLWEGAYINIDYAKPYRMKELNSGNIRTGYSFSNIGLQAAWSRFGIDEYREDILEGNMGYIPWKFVSAGIGLSYYQISINTKEIKYKYGIKDFKFSLLLFPHEWINIGYLQENIYSIWHKDKIREDYLYPGSSAGLAIKPARGITFAYNLNRIYYGYVNSFSVTANMLSCLSLKGGYSRETCLYSFSVNLLYKKTSVSYGLSHHSYLGSTHKVGLTLSTCDFIIEDINYNKSLTKHAFPEMYKKTDINNCSLEELIDSNLFTKEIAERIIKYRATIGQVTKKSLVQIGFPEKELKRKKEYILGLQQEKAVSRSPEIYKTHINKNKNIKSGYDIDTRKMLFQRLLEKGFNSLTALEIAEKAKNTNKTELINKIKDLSNIDEEKKRRQ